MQRRKLSREYNLEAIKLVCERGVSVAQAPAIWMFTRMSYGNGQGIRE